MAETLTALYHRNEVFWMGLAAIFLGVLIPQAVALGGIEISGLFLVTGGALMITSLPVGIYRLLTPT